MDTNKTETTDIYKEEIVVDTKAVELTTSLNNLTKSFSDLSNNLVAKNNSLSTALSSSVGVLVSNLSKSFIALSNKLDANNAQISLSLSNLSKSNSSSFSALDATLAERDNSLNILIDALSKLLDKAGKDENKSTRLINLKDYRVTNNYNILDFNGVGIIKELIIISPSKFNIHIIADDTTKVSNKHYTYDDLALLTSSYVSASAGVGTYTINIKDIHFSKNIFISIDLENTVVLTKLFCIYDIIK